MICHLMNCCAIRRTFVQDSRRRKGRKGIESEREAKNSAKGSESFVVFHFMGIGNYYVKLNG